MLNMLCGGPVESLLLGSQPGTTLIVLRHGFKNSSSTLFTMLFARLCFSISLDMLALAARLVVAVLVEVLLVDPHASERGGLQSFGCSVFWLSFGVTFT